MRKNYLTPYISATHPERNLLEYTYIAKLPHFVERVVTVKTPLWRLTCNPTTECTGYLLQAFFSFNFPPIFFFLYLYLKSHDRTRIRDSLFQCGVTRAGQYRAHLSFCLFLYAMSLNYLRSIRKLKIRLFTVWNVFLLYCCFFGWQGRRHNTLFHTVFDVILVQLNEWIPVLLKCR